MISEFALDVVKGVLSKGDIPRVEGLKGKLNKADPGDNLKSFRDRLKARRAALGLYQLGARHLGNWKDAKERWTAIHSVLTIGAIIKRSSNGQKIGPLLSRELYGLKTKRTYRWKDAKGLLLTKKEREWLQYYGALIENETIQTNEVQTEA